MQLVALHRSRNISDTFYLLVKACYHMLLCFPKRHGRYIIFRFSQYHHIFFFSSTMLVNWAIEHTAYRLCVGWIPSKLNHLSEREPTKTIQKSAFDARKHCKDRNASTCQFNAIIWIRIQSKSSRLFLH